MNRSSREEDWATWMRAAISGDAEAYRRFLQAVTPYLRSAARRHCERLGVPPGESEDVVQEVLLAIHLKRGSWDQARPIGPWIATIMRNKMIDSRRRRGRQVSVPIEDVVDVLEAEPEADPLERGDVDRMLAKLKAQQRDVVRSISLDGSSVRETAERLRMSEGAVRVTLHRALKALAALYRSSST